MVCNRQPDPMTDQTIRICRCCGVNIPGVRSLLSRNPNVCADCSSLADGLGEDDVRVPESLVRDDGAGAVSRSGGSATVPAAPPKVLASGR